MKATVCHQVTIGGLEITLTQLGIDRFEVQYYKQIDTDLNYGQAARKYGAAIMHALAWDGKLDNRERGEK